jgi:hypothetical protein
MQCARDSSSMQCMAVLSTETTSDVHVDLNIGGGGGLEVTLTC